MAIEVKFDIEDIMQGIDNYEHEVMEKMEDIAKDAVQVAKDTGTYHNVTGRLRASNKYKVEKDSVTLFNDCPYAKDVEARGEIVLTSAMNYFEERLNKEIAR